jgi:hypothetical protein
MLVVTVRRMARYFITDRMYHMLQDKVFIKVITVVYYKMDFSVLGIGCGAVG